MKIPNPGYNTCCVCGREFHGQHTATDYIKTKRKSELWFDRRCLERLKHDNEESRSGIAD